ncbi:MAG TPA: hypothetical protein VFE82_00035 [Ramlibacter sp.]|uniref:hypothetical protein n=1 Tax=Ramlibacter sp. TaxID=1917967 RepID=UPI002D598E67|nr:hypothetical protein [Ramlibacter sp.]HZY16831.1 hypothetical protein [Ramlibacter sp.]
MPRSLAAALLLTALAGCSPTFNWREVRVDPTDLRAMFPCKPDKGSRRVPMAGRDVELSVVGCDTGGATFAILHAELGEAGRADEVLTQWSAATLANMKATGSTAAAFVPPGAIALAGSRRVGAEGRRADGSAVHGEAAYFARGGHVFQAVVYAGRAGPEAATFFEGLTFR